MDGESQSRRGSAESHATVSAFMGIDVMAARACPFAVLDQTARQCAHGWLEGPGERKCEQLLQAIETIEKTVGPVAIGIDAPRQPLQAPREHFWDGRRRKWRRRRAREKGNGRHCELVVRALGLANPQWTPRLKQSPQWMRIGFALFECLRGRDHVYEVFPRASYGVMNDAPDTWFAVSLAGWKANPTDMLDACVAAFTVREFVGGRGCEVGGGDGLGSIILPLPVGCGDLAAVIDWPG